MKEFDPWPGWASLAASLFALFAGVASAGLQTVESQNRYELHQTADQSKFTYVASEAECRKAAAATQGDWTCVTRFRLVTTGTCADVPKPTITAVVVDGFLKKPGVRVPVDKDGNWLDMEMEGFVAAPFPDCWVMGWVPYVQEIEPDHGTVDEPTGRAPTP